MKKVIVTTTINPPTKAIDRFQSMADWEPAMWSVGKQLFVMAKKNGSIGLRFGVRRPAHPNANARARGRCRRAGSHRR